MQKSHLTLLIFYYDKNLALLSWRPLFHLRTLSDEAASSMFVALHLPLFFAFFYFGHHKNSNIRDLFRGIVTAFLVIHSGLHFNLSDHEHYQFSGIMSNLYIYGTALCGLGFLVLLLRPKVSSDPT